MTILVDMDDVLETLVEGWTEYLNDRHGLDVKPTDVKCWDMSLAFPTLTKEEVYAAGTDDALWDYVGPKPGAAEALKKLMDEGHEIYVVTASYYQTLRAKMENVLFRYFPFLDWDHVIITSNKHMIKGDVLIDDGPHNLTGGDYRKILFNASHNESFDESSVGAVRVHDWDEACAEIEKIAGELAYAGKAEKEI